MQIKFIYDIGPLLPESYVRRDRDDDILQQGSEETDPCILWLNTRPPSSVIYVSFGSMQTNSPPQLLEMALGLEASGSSFLWLVRPPDSPGMTAALGGPCSITEFLPSGNSLNLSIVFIEEQCQHLTTESQKLVLLSCGVGLQGLRTT